jgi:hypothetical protein
MSKSNKETAEFVFDEDSLYLYGHDGHPKRLGNLIELIGYESRPDSEDKYVCVRFRNRQGEQRVVPLRLFDLFAKRKTTIIWALLHYEYECNDDDLSHRYIIDYLHNQPIPQALWKQDPESGKYICRNPLQVVPKSGGERPNFISSPEGLYVEEGTDGTRYRLGAYLKPLGYASEEDDDDEGAGENQWICVRFIDDEGKKVFAAVHTQSIFYGGSWAHMQISNVLAPRGYVCNADAESRKLILEYLYSYDVPQRQFKCDSSHFQFRDTGRRA